MPTLSKQIIEAAIAGFEGQKLHIDVQIAELRAMLNSGSTTRVTEPKPATAKRKMSPATLRRMREGQQRRWTKAKGESALKKRWAEKKARAVKSMPVAKKMGRKKAA